MPNASDLFGFIKNSIGILIIFVVVYYGILPFILGPKKMKNFCGQVRPGMTLNEVYQLTEETRYKVVENKVEDSHSIYVLDAKAMGRFSCYIFLDQNKVIEAAYRHND